MTTTTCPGCGGNVGVNGRFDCGTCHGNYRPPTACDTFTCNCPDATEATAAVLCDPAESWAAGDTMDDLYTAAVAATT